MRKAIALVLIFIFFLFLGFFGVIAYRGYQFGQKFFTTAEISPIGLYSEIKRGWDQPVEYPSNFFNILVLGSDSLSGRPEDAVLTDTIMLITVGVTTGKITIISVPRDLWVAEYKTKVNALYQYGKKKYPEQPEKFPQEVFSQITGQNIQHTLVVSLNDLGTLIDAIGGIDVSVSKGFTDEMFPVPDVDVATERDPKKLYMTVAFPQGMYHMSGDTALQYIRSRHSKDPEEGTDDARVKRQQQVITSLVHTLLSRKVMMNPETLGTVYRWYKERFWAALPMHDLVALAKTLSPSVRNLSLHEYALPVQEKEHLGVIYHPIRPVDGQWVYLPVDASWASLKKTLLEQL